MPKKGEGFGKKWVALSDSTHITLLSITAARYLCLKDGKQHGPVDIGAYKKDFKLLGYTASLIEHYNNLGLLRSPSWKKFDFKNIGHLYSHLVKDYRRFSLSCPFLADRRHDLTDLLLSPTADVTNAQAILVFVVNELGVAGYRPCAEDITFSPCKSPFAQLKKSKISRPVRSLDDFIPYPAGYGDIYSLLDSRPLQVRAKEWKALFRNEVERMLEVDAEPAGKESTQGKRAPTSTVTSTQVRGLPGSASKTDGSNTSSASVAGPSGLGKRAFSKPQAQEDENLPQGGQDLGQRALDALERNQERLSRLRSEFLQNLTMGEQGFQKSVQKVSTKNQAKGVVSGEGQVSSLSEEETELESSDEMNQKGGKGDEKFPAVDDLSDPSTETEEDVEQDSKIEAQNELKKQKELLKKKELDLLKEKELLKKKEEELLKKEEKVSKKKNLTKEKKEAEDQKNVEELDKRLAALRAKKH